MEDLAVAYFLAGIERVPIEYPRFEDRSGQTPPVDMNGVFRKCECSRCLRSYRNTISGVCIWDSCCAAAFLPATVGRKRAKRWRPRQSRGYLRFGRDSWNGVKLGSVLTPSSRAWKNSCGKTGPCADQNRYPLKGREEEQRSSSTPSSRSSRSRCAAKSPARTPPSPAL